MTNVDGTASSRRHHCVYHCCVEVDFAVELGAEDATLDLPWGTETGPRYYNLKRQPELLLEIEEARRVPGLGKFLSRTNSAASIFETAKCDAWSSTDINAEDEIFGAPCKFVSYVDLVFSDEQARFSFSEHERVAQAITQLLRRVPEIPAAAEFLIRRCRYHQANQIDDGFYITFYLSGYGDDDEQAQQHWAIALELVGNSVRQVSAARQ
jgi:hypothetical protein